MESEEKEDKPKVGRPAWIPTTETIKQVESLAAQGLTEKQISDCLGIHQDTFINKKKEFSEFAEAIKRGQAKGIATIANALFSSAKSGNTTAQLFYLKCRAGWKETNAFEHSGPDGKPIQIEDLSTLTDDQLRALATGKSISGT